MTVEIANKLVKLRKKNGLSQEELADKLGISRQAVSKWERAEASPDTDNLICLAKLYNISLDELLSEDDSIETKGEEQMKKEDKSYVHINKDGIHIEDDKDQVIIDDDGIKLSDGTDEVVIDGNGIKKNGKVVDLKKRRQRQIYGALSGILMSIALIVYIVLGITINTWGTLWILVFVPDIIVSTYKCIIRRRAHYFNMVFFSLFIFFLICLVLFPERNLWHPMWTVFFAIPIYYTMVSRIEVLVCKGKVDEDDE